MINLEILFRNQEKKFGKGSEINIFLALSKE